MLISLTIVFICVLASYSTKGLVAQKEKDNLVVNNLRKQLMQENYDYSMENNETQTLLMRADIKLDKFDSKDKCNQTLYFNNTPENKVIPPQSKHLFAKFDYFTRSNVIDDSQMSYEKDVNKIYKKPLEHPISVKDLLYYIDEEKLLKDKLGPETREMNARRSMDFKESSKKYKVLKTRHQYRRNNPRRFIQEEGKDGVVVISLDNGTFPLFRLPRSRRQYMHDHGEVAEEEEELPPPPISSFVAEDVGKTLTKVQV